MAADDQDGGADAAIAAMRRPETLVKSIETRLHEHYDSLPESERKLADVILDFPGDLGAFKATELTALAGVSKAAATRLFRRLGFASFDEARLLARERRDWGSPLYMETKATGGAIKTGLGALVEDETRLLKATTAKLKPALVDDVSSAIVGARRVWMAGFRNSRFLAEYLRWQLIQFRGDVHLIPGHGETAGEYTADMTPSDVLLVIGLRRRVKGLAAILEAAKNRGVPIVLITDPTARRLPALATWTIMAETSGTFTFDSCGPALAICRHLAVESFHKAGRRGRAHMERVEREHEKLDAFN